MLSCAVIVLFIISCDISDSIMLLTTQIVLFIFSHIFTYLLVTILDS